MFLCITASSMHTNIFSPIINNKIENTNLHPTMIIVAKKRGISVLKVIKVTNSSLRTETKFN